MSRFTKFALTSVAVACVGSSALASTVSVNWKEFSGGVNDALDGYGVVPANNWVNTQGTIGTDLIDSDGATSSVDFSATIPGGLDTFNFGTLNNTPMRAGPVIFDATATPVTITFSDLSSTFIDYDIIVYVTGFNAANNVGQVTDGTDTYIWGVPNPYDPALIQSTDTDNSDGADVGTYVRFDGRTADSFTLTMTTLGGGVGIGGVQISGTPVPEPATAMLMLLGLGMLRRR